MNSTPSRSKGAIVGAGAQGRITAIVWRRIEPNCGLVFFDDNEGLWNESIEGVPVAGKVDAARIRQCAAETMVALGDNRKRSRLAAALREGGLRFATIVDPSAVIMPGAALGAGVFVGPHAVVHIGASIGDHAIVNTGAIVEHDCIVAEGANLSPGVRMGGRVTIDRNCFIGTGVTLAPRVIVGENSIVGAGAVVTRDIPSSCVAYGCPARVIRSATDQDWARLF